MSIKKDLAKIAIQEERLQFQNFDADTAWKLGNRLKANAETRGVAVTIEIRVGKETVFFFATLFPLSAERFFQKSSG